LSIGNLFGFELEIDISRIWVLLGTKVCQKQHSPRYNSSSLLLNLNYNCTVIISQIQTQIHRTIHQGKHTIALQRNKTIINIPIEDAMSRSTFLLLVLSIFVISCKWTVFFFSVIWLFLPLLLLPPFCYS